MTMETPGGHIDDLFAGKPCGRQLAAVHRISSALFAKTDVDALLQETLHVCIETAEADAGSILLLDEETGDLVFRFVEGPVAEKLIGTRLDPQGTGRCAGVYRTGISEIANDGFDIAFDSRSGYATRSALTSAIRTFDGRAIGVVQVLNRRDGSFDHRDQELLEITTALAATVLENARRAEIEKQAALHRMEAEKQTALSRVLGFIGHQLKNQALIIQQCTETFGPPIRDGLSQLAARDQQDAVFLSDQFRELVGMLGDASAKAAEQAKVINEYAQRQDLFEFAPGYLKPVLETELAQLVGLAERYGTTLDLAGIEDGPAFRFEAFFVGQAVFSLVNNAFQAFRETGHGDTVGVSVRYLPQNERFPAGHAEIRVSDNGPGMSEELISLVLRGEAPSSKPGGSGVGTRLVHDVALTHGGEFAGMSALGGGTTLWLRIPLADVHLRP